MCGRFNQTNLNSNKSDNRYLAMLNRKNRKQAANISINNEATIITNDNAVTALFGFKAAWDEKKVFINATAEGKSEDGSIGIQKMPTFGKAFKNTRCIIPVNSFIEGPEKEKLSKPYNILSPNGLMFLAGIYRLWTSPDGVQIPTVAIITTKACPICETIGHHRSPAMLHENEDVFEHWLNPSTNLEAIIDLLATPYSDAEMFAEPLNPQLVKRGDLHSPEVLTPIGPRIEEYGSTNHQNDGGVFLKL